MMEASRGMHLQKSADSPLHSALSKLHDRISPLRKRLFLFFGISLGSAFVGFMALALLFILPDPSAHLVWQHVYYPAVLTQVVSPDKGFAGVVATFVQTMHSSLGLSLAIAALLIGGSLGVMRNSPFLLLMGVATGVFLHFGPSLLYNWEGSIGGKSVSASVRHLSFTELEKIQAKYTKKPELELPLLWVIAQKQYFGKPGPSFSQEVADLDQAYFQHNQYLPNSVTRDRLLHLSEKAVLPGQVARLQEAQDTARQQDEHIHQVNLLVLWICSALLALFGLPAILLYRRIGRLGQKLRSFRPSATKA